MEEYMKVIHLEGQYPERKKCGQREEELEGALHLETA